MIPVLGIGDADENSIGAEFMTRIATGRLEGALTRHWLLLAANGLVFVLFGLQCFNVQAELVFRSLEQVNGQAHWSAVKKYTVPADVGPLRRGRGGAGTDVDEVRVFLSGEITRQDLDGAAVMAAMLKSGQQRLAGNTIWFASPGGDIDVGMELGRLLRKLEIYTSIDKSDRCMSACVFAFMGGERRSVAGQLGIHRPYFPFTQYSADRPAKYRHLEKTLREFIEELDFPASLYEAVMLVPPQSMQIVSAADLKRFYLDGISPMSEDKVDAAEARRLSLTMSEYLQHKAQTPGLSFTTVASSGQ